MIHKLDDFISSDREAAAFVLALDKLNAPEQPAPAPAPAPVIVEERHELPELVHVDPLPKKPAKRTTTKPKSNTAALKQTERKAKAASWPCPKRTARRRPKPSAHGARHEKTLRKLRMPPPLCSSLILQALPPACWHDTKPPRILWQGCTDESNPAPLPTGSPPGAYHETKRRTYHEI